MKSSSTESAMARSIRQHFRAKTIAVATTVNTRKHCYQVMTSSDVIIRIFKCTEYAGTGRALLLLNHRFCSGFWGCIGLLFCLAIAVEEFYQFTILKSA